MTGNLPQELRTERLLLRRWRPADREPFAALNADPRVMEFFPGLLSREDSDALVARIEAHFDRHSFGLWAVEVVGVTPFAGFVGLSVPRFEAPFTPCVEIGWRLSTDTWGHGYATEGARAALAFGFGALGLEEVVSFTVPHNLRSRRVMEKLGMTHHPDEDFDHPLLPAGHPLSRHVLYRIACPAGERSTEPVEGLPRRTRSGVRPGPRRLPPSRRTWRSPGGTGGASAVTGGATSGTAGPSCWPSGPPRWRRPTAPRRSPVLTTNCSPSAAKGRGWPA